MSEIFCVGLIVLAANEIKHSSSFLVLEVSYQSAFGMKITGLLGYTTKTL